MASTHARRADQDSKALGLLRLQQQPIAKLVTLALDKHSTPLALHCTPPSDRAAAHATALRPTHMNAQTLPSVTYTHAKARARTLTVRSECGRSCLGSNARATDRCENDSAGILRAFIVRKYRLLTEVLPVTRDSMHSFRTGSNTNARLCTCGRVRAVEPRAAVPAPTRRPRGAFPRRPAITVPHVAGKAR